MSPETVAGRKRKGTSLAPLAPSKRPARASGGWASLPTDIVFLVLRRVLSGGGGGDIVDYIAFRGVCFYWRACTPPPGDHSLRDPLLRPRGWVALCDGDAIRPDDACEIPFFNTRTARRIRVHLPELRRHRIVGFTDGLVILLHKSTSKVRVLHPFTRVAVDLPPLARVYREEVGRWKEHMFKMTAVVCGANSANSIAVVVRFVGNVVVAAEPDDTDWKLISRRRDVWSMLSFHGKVYGTLSPSREIVQLYPPPLGDGDSQLVVIAQIPNMISDRIHFLVESGGRMLVADRYPPAASELRVVGHWLYEVHLRSGGGIGKLTRVKSLGDRALFLNTNRCLSVSAKNLPSLGGNSIYFYNMFGSSVVLHSLTTGLSEKYAEHCQIHNRVDRIRPSVRPFTIADHLLTYCHHLQWAQGLMFHEYHHIPASFKELLDSIEANDSKLRIPTVRRLRRG